MTKSSLDVRAAGCAPAASLAIAPLPTYAQQQPATQQQSVSQQQSPNGVDAPQRAENVDEDVDLFDTNDVLWAMQTRYSGDMDTICVPGVAGHVLDPSQTPLYDPRVTAKGTTHEAWSREKSPIAFQCYEHVEFDPVRGERPRGWAPR
jgi:hypothetical protein